MTLPASGKEVAAVLRFQAVALRWLNPTTVRAIKLAVFVALAVAAAVSGTPVLAEGDDSGA